MNENESGCIYTFQLQPDGTRGVGYGSGVVGGGGIWIHDSVGKFRLVNYRVLDDCAEFRDRGTLKKSSY